MSELTVTTNGHARELIALADLSDAERADFDYITGDEIYSARLFRYRSSVYDMNEFQRIDSADSGDSFAIRADSDSPLAAWNGAQADSYFSGIVVRYARDWSGQLDTESIVVGSWSN